MQIVSLKLFSGVSPARFLGQLPRVLLLAMSLAFIGLGTTAAQARDDFQAAHDLFVQRNLLFEINPTVSYAGAAGGVWCNWLREYYPIETGLLRLFTNNQNLQETNDDGTLSNAEFIATSRRNIAKIEGALGQCDAAGL